MSKITLPMHELYQQFSSDMADDLLRPSRIISRYSTARDNWVRSTLERISEIADGRDNLDGFPRPNSERQRRLSEIKSYVHNALRSVPEPVDQSAPKSWLEAKAEVDSGWPDRKTDDGLSAEDIMEIILINQVGATYAESVMQSFRASGLKVTKA